MSNSSIIENIHKLLEEEHSNRIKRMHFRSVAFLTIISKRQSIKKKHCVPDEVYLQVIGGTINFMYCYFIINYINQLDRRKENM